MREVFHGLHMESKPINYTVGGGSGTPAMELLIWNDNAEKAPRQNGSNLNLF